MNPSRGDRFAMAIRGPAEPRDELQEAFENYQRMKEELSRIQAECQTLRIENGSMVAEVNMLREQLSRADADRVRLQAVSSTLVGQLRAINAVIGDAMRMALKNGIEAVESMTPEEQKIERQELEKAGSEVRGIIERAAPAQEPEPEELPVGGAGARLPKPEL